MKDYIEALESKWGPLQQEGHYYSNGKMSFISEKARLNILFTPENLDTLDECFEKCFGAQLIDGLRAFYKRFNGCRLFSGSLNIWGLRLHSQEVFEPYDIKTENLRVSAKIDFSEEERAKYVFFASFGGEYLFCFQKESGPTIYGFKNGHTESSVQFESFLEFFDFFFEKLVSEYDKDCRKIHPNIEYSGMPILENLTYKLF